MLITALGGWNNLVILPAPEINRLTRRAASSRRRKKNA